MNRIDDRREHCSALDMYSSAYKDDWIDWACEMGTCVTFMTDTGTMFHSRRNISTRFRHNKTDHITPRTVQQNT